MSRRRPAALCSGARGTAIVAVVQLGLAIMRRGACRRASALTSGMTSGTSGSMRKAAELSMTIAPAAAASGTSSLATSSGVSKMTSSRSWKAARDASSTTCEPIRLPADRLEANSLSVDAGKLRSCRTRNASRPTTPVAPTMPTRYPVMVSSTSSPVL